MSILAVVLLWASQVSQHNCVAKDLNENLLDSGAPCSMVGRLKIHIDGNNEAASTVRRKINEASKRYEKDACFEVASKPSQSDATLTLDQRETSGGVGALTSLIGEGSTTVVSAELTSKDGTVLWQESKQGMPGITSTGASGGAGRVLEALYKSHGCDKKGKRQ